MSSFVTAGGDIGNGELLAQNAQDTADEANKKNSANSQQIANINDPNYLTPFEKPQLEIQMDNFAAIYKTDKDIAEAEGIDFTAYDAAYQAYLAYMKPLTADISTYSPIVRTTFNSLVTAVQNAKTAFDAATKAQYTQAMDKAKTDIANGQSSYAAMKQDVATMKTNANGVATIASAAISSAGFASDVASTASQAANDAKTVASQAANNVAIAKNDAANALTSATTAFNTANGAKDSAGTALDNAKSALNKVNGLQFGGRNLILNSANLSGFPTWVADGNKPTTTADGSEMTIVTKHGGLNINSANLSKNIPNIGDTVTISVEAKGTATLEFNYQNGNDYMGSQHFTITDEYKRYFAQYTWNPINVSANQQFVIFTSDSTDTTLIIKNPKLEVGNVATDWTPAPEDVQVQISDINGELASKVSQDTYNSLAGTVDQVSTLSKQNQSALVTKADSQAVDTLKQRVTTAENTLTQTATKTELEQTNTDVDKLNNTVKSSSSEITAQAGKIDGLLNSTTDINGKLTTLQGNFDLSSKQLSTTMSKVDSNIVDFNNLTISNRNLALGTATPFKMTGNNTEDQGHVGYGFSKTIQKGTVVTATFDVSSTTGVGRFTVQFSGNDSGSSWKSIAIDNLAKGTNHVSKTFTADANQLHVFFRLDYATGDVEFSNFIISESSKEVSWSPAPEDQATVTALTQVKQTAKGASQLSKDNHGNILALQSTAKGLQTSVSNAATKDQLTILSSQLTNKITDLKSSTSSQFTQTSNDINGLVKKGDVVNQFNIDAGGALLQTVGGNTKIVLSAPNVIVDSANPMQIQNANIVGTLTGKTIEASSITSTTKIIGSDIQAAMIHSADNSFSLDKDGNILGASIGSSPAATNAWNISKEGKISGASVTSSLIDITGDGSGPNFDAENVTPDTATGIYSGYKYTNPNVGFDVNGMGRKMYKNGYLVINGDTFLNRTIGDWSADGGGKYVYDTMYEANVIKMRAYNYTGSNVQTDDPSKTQGDISSRLDIQPSAITMGPNFSVGNPNILIDGDGLLKVGSIAINGNHSMGTTDGSDMYFMKMNKDATDVSGTSIPIHAARYYTANMGISGGHVINSYDGHDVYLEDKWGSGGNMVSLHVKKLYNSSLLSLKTDITTIDPNDALETIANTDFRSYRFKTDDPSEPKSVSPILDDENQIPIYNTPNIFKSADGKNRNDGNILGYTALSVQALYAKIKDLTARLQKLEGAN